MRINRLFPVPLFVAMVLAGSAFGQDTSVTVAAEPVAGKSTRSIILLGEQISGPSSSEQTSPAKVMVFARDIIGGVVTDETVKQAKLNDLATSFAASHPPKADVYVVFAGASDESAGTSDEVQRVSAQKIAELLGKQGRVFMAPSGTTVSASISANLRLAALQGDAQFVTLGTESGGREVEEAFEAVRDELGGARERVESLPPMMNRRVDAATTAGAPPRAAEMFNERLAVPDNTPVPPARVQLSEELARIAGESDALAPLSTDTEDLRAISVEDSGSTAGSNARTMSKRGAEAKETINMRPLPAVKAFRPKIPVPRSQVNVKEPALSR